jgi:hypothetical protein
VILLVRPLLQPILDGLFLWYKFFTDQLEKMWDSAKPWEPEALAARNGG